MTTLADMVVNDCLIDDTILKNNKNVAFLQSGHASLTRVACLEGPTQRSKIRVAWHSDTQDNRPYSETPTDPDCGSCDEDMQVAVLCPIVDLKKCNVVDGLLERIQCTDKATIGALIDTIQDDWDRSTDRMMLEVLMAATLGADCGINGDTCNPDYAQYSTTNYHDFLGQGAVIPALDQSQILAAMQSAGEMSDKWDAMVMHSTVYHYLESMNLIESGCVTDCETFPGRVVGSMYGCRIIVDDYMEPITNIGYSSTPSYDPDDQSGASPAVILYPILLLMPDVLTVKDGSDPAKILEVGRNIGCDKDRYWSRRRQAYCPYGASYIPPSIDDDIQSKDDVIDACNWESAFQDIPRENLEQFPFKSFCLFAPLTTTTLATVGTDPLVLCDHSPIEP